MAGESIGVGFIGSGFMGRAHGHALHTINHIAPLDKRIRLVAIAGRRPERVETIARQLGFERSTTSWEAVVEDPDVDVVANLAPDHLHAAPSIAALELGKPVLCEKPLARNATEAGAMIAAAEAAGVTHSCAFNYRFVPAVRLAHQVIGSGRLGELRHFRALYLQDWAGSPSRPREWRFEKAGNGSGAVGDYSHIVDLLRHLGGEPLAVSAQTARFVAERPDPDAPGDVLPVEVEDAYAAVFDLGGSAMANLEASRCATGWKGRQYIELNCSEGSLWWNMEDLNRLHAFFVEDEREGLGGFRDVLVTQPEHPFLGRWWPPGHILGWEHTFVHQWLDFLGAAIESRPVPEGQASFEDGYRAAVVCDAILASAKEGRRLDIARIESGVT
jgi:predicted dehydrogenase